MLYLEVLMAFLFFLYGAYQTKNIIVNRNTSRTIVRGIKKQNENKQSIQLKKIKALDPNFDIPKIIDRVEQAFYIIKQAWSDHDMASARAFISDGVYQRNMIQFTIQKAHNRHITLDKVLIHSCELVGIESDKHFETLHFKITSRAKYHTTKNNESQPVKELVPFTTSTEYWTYIRLPGVQTRSKPGLIEGICPNCGAVLVLSKFEQCQNCQSLVTSGEYDWILAKITQEEEWRFQNAKRQIKGVAEYQVVDPMFNLPIIEDRVSVIFWQLQKAWLTQNTDPIRGIAHPDYSEHFAHKELNNYYFDNIELGLCEVNNIEFGEEFDQILVLVKWKANKIFISENKNPINGYYAHYLTLIRKTGVTSDIVKGLHSLHCFSCGAPQSESDLESCEYCFTPFNQGDANWVLKDFSPRINRIMNIQGKQFEIEPKQAKVTEKIFDPTSLLSGLVLILFADGKIDPKEQALLNDFVKKRRIPQHVLNDILLAQQTGELNMLAPDETLDASAWLTKMIEMCLIDGNVSAKERQLLIHFGKRFNILPIDIDLKIKQMRNKLYREGKLALSI
jgi:hypothetical protein